MPYRKKLTNEKSGHCAEDRIAEMRGVGDRISEMDGQVREVEAVLADIVLTIPNMPHPSVPQELMRMPIRKYVAGVKAENLTLSHCRTGKLVRSEGLDFERGGKVT